MQWEIQPRSRFCFDCGREFLDGDGYRCVLSYREEEPFRRDFCEGCWGSERQFEPEEELISWWQSTVKILPPKPKEEAIKRSLAEQLLRKYIRFREPKYINFCYILGLMLERRRILLPKHTVEEDPSGKTLIIYEHAKTGETLIIMDPHLTLSQVAQVQAQLKEILDSEQKEGESEEKRQDKEESIRADQQSQGEPEK